MSEHSDEDDDGLKMDRGSEISTKNSKYVIMEKIGEGGFGAVYKVKRKTGKEVYAMKVEKKSEKRDHSKLSMEVHLLKLLGEKKGSRHFVKIIDRSKKPSFFLIVMTLVGESLADLKRQRSPPIFSVSTGLGVAIQCLEAIEELHKAGYVHRDIKAGNFSIGRYPLTHLIYVLDFGIARKYTTDDNAVKAPRRKVSFKGTVTYAAIDSHLGKELGPKHDCESWMYMLVDFCHEDGLPWVRDRADLTLVLHKKKKARTAEGKRRLFRPICTEAMSSIMDYIDKLSYPDRVDYHFINCTLEKAAEVLHLDLGSNFDWESGGGEDQEDMYTAGTAMTVTR